MLKIKAITRHLGTLHDWLSVQTFQEHGMSINGPVHCDHLASNQVWPLLENRCVEVWRERSKRLDTSGILTQSWSAIEVGMIESKTKNKKDGMGCFGRGQIGKRTVTGNYSGE